MILPKTKLSFSYLSLFRFATCWEKLLIVLGLITAFLSAFGLLAAIIIYGELTTLFVDRTVRNGTSTQIYILEWFGGGYMLRNGTDEDYRLALVADSEAYGIASVVVVAFHFVTAVVSVQLLNWTAVRQISRIRLLFLRSVIRQDMSWYDTETNLNFASRVTDDLEKLKEGIAEKVAMFVYLVGTVIVCCGVALAYGWELTLVGLTVVPLTIGVAAIVLRIQANSTNKELEAYSHAGRVVEEVLSGIRTVVAFNGEQKEIERYAKRLAPAEKCGKRRGAITGIGAGFNWFLTYLLNSIIFLYGTQLIVRDFDLPEEEKSYYPGTMVTILFSIYCAAQNIALCSPHTETFSAAKGAARSIFQLLDRRPEIDCLSTAGTKPSGGLVGSITLDNVFFNYPSRADVKILRGLTLQINPGETVALVGSSGCGKSTILQLVQRLYDPASGSVSIDGHPIKNLNVSWLRNHLGVVGQEPVLFSGTIRENIALGKDNATFEEVKEAARKAFAHDFIQSLADGYETMIGERGAQLSGGQKQRIAIARSLIRDPKILLLDEATSALDLRSEKKVQAALDKASEGRTTLVVSHRLSTVINATRIVYIDKGAVAEQGTHEELLAKQGLYWKLVQTDQENRQVATTIDTLKEENGTDDDVEDGQALEDGAVKSCGFTALNRHSARPNSFIRDSVTPERPPAYSSLRMVQRRSSISSVKSTGMVQVNPAMYEDDTPEDTQDMDGQVSAWQLLKLNAEEWPYIVIGCVASGLVGCTLPLFALLFSEVYGMFSYSDKDEIIAASQLYAGLFALVAFLCGLATFTQTHVFTIAGLKLTTRLRVQTFQSFLKQEIGWFDDQTNSVGALCARLSTDAAAVQGATGMRVGTILQGVATMVIGVVIAMVYSWKMTLVSLVTIPLVIGGIYLEGAVMKAAQITERKAMETASKIATEAIMNVRTVQSMGIEGKILAKYTVALDQAGRAGNIRTRMRGCVYAMGLTAPTLGYAVSLYYGGLLIANENMPYKTAILVSEALIYGSWMLGQALSFAPNFSAAKVSGSRIVKLIGREPQIKDAENIKDDPTWTAKGDICYKSVQFRYPTRLGVPVLRGLNLRLEPGKTIALVGHSGCGKSTCLQLLQRLYDAEDGTVTLDNKNIAKELTLARLRAQLGIVQQEPVLFDKTISENIMYGDNSRQVSMDEVVTAAKAANIHNFITGLPSGYETNLGSKGAQLSGGQKQRIAIARALVRNPRILLLDEATSALDTQSEKLVQQALDSAKEGRTCIIIAHRLATIQNADAICVLDKGKVAERGTHAELMQRRGLYYELHELQSNTT